MIKNIMKHMLLVHDVQHTNSNAYAASTSHFNSIQSSTVNVPISHPFVYAKRNIHSFLHLTCDNLMAIAVRQQVCTFYT